MILTQIWKGHIFMWTNLRYNLPFNTLVQNNWSKLYLVKSGGWQVILKVVKQIRIYCSLTPKAPASCLVPSCLLSPRCCLISVFFFKKILKHQLPIFSCWIITVVCQNLFPLISCPQPSHINVVFKEINHLTSYFWEIVYVSPPNILQWCWWWQWR